MTRGAVRIGRLFGARVVVSPLFVGLLLLLGAAGLIADALVVFGVAFLHEIAHVATAAASGLKVREVELLPFGGVARVDDLVEMEPGVEIAVAVAGPLTNLFLYVVGRATLAGAGIPEDLYVTFLNANLAIGGINMIPALPLDGGRIARALWTRRIGFRRATERAARLGMLFAVLLALAGVVLVYRHYVNVSVLVFAAFLYAAAGKERSLAAYVFLRYLARKRRELRRRRCLAAQPVVAVETTPIKEVVNHFVPQRYHLVWVLDENGRLAGCATEAEIIDALFRLGPRTPIGDVVRG